MFLTVTAVDGGAGGAVCGRHAVRDDNDSRRGTPHHWLDNIAAVKMI
jgi:hypothetical protein